MNTGQTNQAEQSSAVLLLVDDEPNVLKALRRLFHSENYTLHLASGGAEGLEVLRQHPVDLIISDMRMPEMSGAEFLAQAFEHWPETIRILLTGYSDLQSTIDAVNKGRIFSYCNKPWNDEELKLLIKNALAQKRLREERDRFSKVISQQNEQLKEFNERLENLVQQRTAQLSETLSQLDQTNRDLKKQYVDSIKAFSRIIEMRPGIKGGHSKYIAENAHHVAKQFNLSEEETKSILYAGLLLQIGKMTLPDKILEQPVHLMDVPQKRIYLKHAQEAAPLLKGLVQLTTAVKLIHHQYESFNGSGSPDGLAGEEIPIGSRILSVVRDYIGYVEGTMTGKAMPVNDAKNQLRECKGKQYDPNVVDLFLQFLADTTDKENTRPTLDISWTQLRPGMEVEEISYDGQVYLKNCTLTERMVDSILTLRANKGTPPLIRIRLGVNENLSQDNHPASKKT
ncbi:MAG: HD domain-containing phosphohydrolase [Methylococcaceae bacterium]|jgi:response regulator RpfG family c-di-GMP phosphodiesterase